MRKQLLNLVFIFIAITANTLNSVAYGVGNANDYKHFIIYGQSLSTGHQSYPVISTENIPGNYMLGEQIWINYGNKIFSTFNPLVGTISNTFKTNSNIMNRAAGTIAECPLFGAVNHIQLKEPGQKILATSCGTSGKSIEELSRESQTTTLYNDFTKTITSAANISKSTGATISCPAIFFMQGEWNYKGNGTGLTAGTLPTSDKEAYKTLLLTLKNNMQTDIRNMYGQVEKPFFICYQTGASYITGKEQTIGMAQLEASNENQDIACAGSVAPMTDRGGHLDANGYRWYGEMLGKVYYKTAVLKEKFRPLQPCKISRTNNPNQLKIEFLIPVKPLVMDSLILPKVKDYGFEIYLANVKQTIKSIRIIDDCVYIDCASHLTGMVEVAYAGQNTAGNGNLRDSDPYQSFFTYIDLDKKNGDGSYFFSRDATETTLRPTYEPKNANGLVIYNQPYPLYNFGISFYYKIDANQQDFFVQNLANTDVSVVDEVNKQLDLRLFQSGEDLIFDNSEKNINKLELYSISGKIMKSFYGFSPKYSITGLPKSMYIAKVIYNEQTCCKKLFIY